MGSSGGEGCGGKRQVAGMKQIMEGMVMARREMRAVEGISWQAYRLLLDS